MDKNNKPHVVVSSCLGFSNCRYDGQGSTDPFVNKLKDYVQFTTVCPEVDIGLGIPRDTIRLVCENDEIILFQPATGRVYTKEMIDFSHHFLNSLKDVDGFILKGRSPSCGTKDVKIYLGKEKGVRTIKGAGIFASHVQKEYPHLPIEEEGRLTNFRIREHFLSKLYTMFHFRQVEQNKSMAELVHFQSNNKYLLMAYNQKQQKVLGKIVANHDNRPFEELIVDYKYHLGLALARLPRYSNYINTMMHIYGHFSDHLSSKEKEFIFSTFDKYRNGNVPLSVPIHLLHSYAIRYEQPYLLDQTIWSAYPEDLMDISDTGK